MRIVAIEPSGALYGSECCLLDVIRGTANRGLDWTVVLPRGHGLDRVLEQEEIPARYLLPAGAHTLPRRKKLLSYWRVRQHLIKHRPAVVYLNQAGMLRAVNAITAGLDIPTVCQVQTLEDARFIAAHPRAHRPVRAFIFNSRFTAAHAQVAPEKCCIFYQGVAGQSVATNAEPPEEDGVWRIGILGRIAVSKGHYILLEAAKQLVDGERRDLQFVVIGEGLTPQDTLRFGVAVDRAGLSAHFEFRGFRHDVAAELARLHLLVIPSPAEPLGRVLLDASAAGLPALVSDGGGLGEFSRHLDIGYRVVAGDASAWATSIPRFLAHYEEERGRFRDAANRLFRRLAPEPYFNAVTTVIKNAAEGRASAMEWLGEES